jgi:hypothetical protein
MWCGVMRHAALSRILEALVPLGMVADATRCFANRVVLRNVCLAALWALAAVAVCAQLIFNVVKSPLGEDVEAAIGLQWS